MIPIKQKILIVDDNQDLVMVLREFLEHHGFEIMEAYEGIRGIEIAHKKTPDLILLDLQMPAGTGQSVLQALRSRKETQEIPVIVLTGRQEPNLEKEMLAAGAQGFLLKPYSHEILLDKIRACLG